MPDSSQDERVVRDALAGAPGARRKLAERLIDAIQREVTFVLRRHGGEGRDFRQEVRDMVQEVLVSLFDNDCQELRRWTPERGRNLDSFVRLVARRRAARILSQKKGNPWAQLPIDPETIETHQSDAETNAVVRQLEQRHQLGSVLDALYTHMSPRDLELFDLLFVQERDPADVAELLQMTRGAVNAWRYRTRKLARACMLGNAESASSPGLSTARGTLCHD